MIFIAVHKRASSDNKFDNRKRSVMTEAKAKKQRSQGKGSNSPHPTPSVALMALMPHGALGTCEAKWKRFPWWWKRPQQDSSLLEVVIRWLPMYLPPAGLCKLGNSGKQASMSLDMSLECFVDTVHPFQGSPPRKELCFLDNLLFTDGSLHMLWVVYQQTFTRAHTPAFDPASSLAVCLKYWVSGKGASRGQGSSTYQCYIIRDKSTSSSSSIENGNALSCLLERDFLLLIWKKDMLLEFLCKV